MSEHSRYWLVDEEPVSSIRLATFLKHGKLRLLNEAEIVDRWRDFNLSLPGNAPWPDALPGDFPRPVFRMPLHEATNVLPDYFSYGIHEFVSARLREAMALPDWAVSYVPVEYDSASRHAVAQRYALMRLRAFARLIDIDRTVGNFKRVKSAKTGDLLTRGPIHVAQFRDEVAAPCGLFEDQTLTIPKGIATDELAARVIEASCTGIVFTHPKWQFLLPVEYLVKTATGVSWVRSKNHQEPGEYRMHASAWTMDQADLGPSTEGLQSLIAGNFKGWSDPKFRARIASGL